MTAKKVTQRCSCTRGRWLRRTVSVVAWVMSVAVSVALIVTAYAGYVKPTDFHIAGVLPLCFGLCVLATVIVLVLTLFVRWRAAIPVGVAMLLCIGPLWDFCPLNLPQRLDEAERSRSFTLMSYNVLGLYNRYDVYPDDTNPTLSYILRADADVVCVQELETLTPFALTHVGQAQLDSIHARYPYVLYNGLSQVLFSKFPAEAVRLSGSVQHFSGGDVAAYRLNIHGRTVNIFNVHLQSYCLTGDDKQLYGEVARLRAGEEDLQRVRTQLGSKLAVAAVKRQAHARHLVKYLERFGGPDAIVCGDFNDVAGCYTVRLLDSESHMRQAYADAGFGPMITYSADGFRFRIDHVLYRGGMRPASMVRGKCRTSDHYPVIARFVFDAPE